MAGNVKLTVQLQAQDRATKVIRATHKANKQLVESMIKAGNAQTKLGAKVAMAIGTQTKYRRALIRTADAASTWGKRLASMKAAVGALAAAMAVRAFKDWTIEGEKAANVAIRFAQAIPFASTAMEGLKAASAGLVTDTELQIIANRFSRLGVPIKTTTRLLELATKAAIDQGRGVGEVAKVIESSLKGRTTGLVEIGVNLDKITGLTEAYAAQTGQAVGELDEMDRRLKVALPAALRALGEQFDGVDLESFRLEMQQTSTAWDDLVSRWQEGTAHIVAGTVEAFTPAEETIGQLVRRFGNGHDALAELNAEIEKNGDTFGYMWMVQGRVEQRTRDVSDQMHALRDRLAGLKPEDRIAAFDALGDAMGRMSAEARATVEALFHLESAQAQIGQRGLTFDVAADVTAGGPVMEWWSDQVDKMEKAAAAPVKKRRGGGGGGRAAAQARAQLAELERLAALREQVIAMQAQDDLERARLKHQQALVKAAQQLGKLQTEDEEQRGEFVRLSRQKAQLAFDKEREKIEKRRAKAEADAAKALEAARMSLRIAQATTEQEVIRLELQQRIAEIQASEVDGQIKLLQIEHARSEAAARRAALEAQSREEMLSTFSEGFTGAFASGADILGRLDQNLAQLGHPERYQNISAGFAAVSAGIAPAIESFAKLGKSSMASGDKVASGVAAGLGAIGPAVAGFVGGVKEQAMVMGAFEAAMAIATAFTNTAEAISHGIASAMFFAMAGVASAQPTTPATTAPTGGTGVGFSGGGGSGEPGTVVVNIGEGMVFGRPSEIGRAVAQRMASMNGTGMEATAF